MLEAVAEVDQRAGEIAGIAAGRLQGANGFVDLAGPQKPHAHLEAMAHLGRIAVGSLAEEIQLAGVDFLDQARADRCELFVVRTLPQLPLGDGQVAAKRLDLQVGQLDSQVGGPIFGIGARD